MLGCVAIVEQSEEGTREREITGTRTPLFEIRKLKKRARTFTKIFSIKSSTKKLLDYVVYTTVRSVARFIHLNQKHSGMKKIEVQQKQK
jgi:hypothetical protein